MADNRVLEVGLTGTVAPSSLAPTSLPKSSVSAGMTLWPISGRIRGHDGHKAVSELDFPFVLRTSDLVLLLLLEFIPSESC